MTTTAPTTGPAARILPETAAASYAEWFACLSEPSRVRLLHAVATTPGGVGVGALGELLGISQSTCSHHVRKLAGAGFLVLHKEGTTTRVTVDPACLAVPHAADAALGLLAPRPERPVPAGVTVRALEPDDWPAVRRVYAEGIATGTATFETSVPTRASLDAKWLPGHRWVAVLDGAVAGWTALSPTSTRECYAGVAESAVYVTDGARGRGVGTALVRKQVTAADDAGLWTLQSAIFTTNRASIALHHAAGYRTVGVRERIGRLGGVWHDTVLIERRAREGAR
jgi:L-amino acid N-acyltransferase YncA/DNA-binding transcriptional ArsR family regulator